MSVLHREYRPRENVTFLENGTKLYALNPKSFVFVPEKSAGNPEVDMVTTINIPFVVSDARKRRRLRLWMTAAISVPQTVVPSGRRDGEFPSTAAFPPGQRRVSCLPGGDGRAELLLLLPAEHGVHLHVLPGRGRLHEPHRPRNPVGLQGPAALKDPQHEARRGRIFRADVEGKRDVGSNPTKDPVFGEQTRTLGAERSGFTSPSVSTSSQRRTPTPSSIQRTPPKNSAQGSCGRVSTL